MGYHDRETGRLFLRENLLTNLAGTLIGLPLGVWMLVGSMAGFETDAYSFPAILRPVSYLYTLLLAVVFVWCTQWVVHRDMRQINRVEALSMKE